MATGKTSTLTFRIEPALKEALRSAAVREHRSIANMVEVLIRDWCSRNRIIISEHPSTFDKAGDVPNGDSLEERGNRP